MPSNNVRKKSENFEIFRFIQKSKGFCEYKTGLVNK